MIPQTIGLGCDVGQIALIHSIKDDSLKDLEIEGHCFLMLIIREGTAYFQVGDMAFEAVGPCFVCFDEREQPKLIRKRGLKCDSIYFHPTFLNSNITFELVHSLTYKDIATNHDLFLLRPFTDEQRYVFPLFEEYADNLNRLFIKLINELKEQRDWYWSCRSRSYFMEIILMLERVYGIMGYDEQDKLINKLKKPHLKKAVVFIESHYYENITLEHICKAASSNHSTMAKLFKDELHMTPIEYLWSYRITIAKKHLEFTNLPIKDISALCGFKTIQHFSRKFEELTKSTPTAFRDASVARRKEDF